MNDRQEAKLDAYTALETVLTAHPSPLNTVPAGQAAAVEFGALLADLRTAVEQQADYTPIGPQKEARLRDLARIATPIAQAVAAWAATGSDLPLARQMDVHESDFTRARDQDARALGALVLAHATAHIEDLADYGVTARALTELDAHLQAYAEAIGQPRHAIAERKLQTEALDVLFDRIDALLTQRLDRIVEQFRGTPFFSEYRTARTLVGP